MATGTGVDLIHVYATPSGGSATYLGAATYGLTRPDIATLYGQSRFTNSGYTFGASLTPGTYTLTVYAFKSGVLGQSQAVTNVTVAPAVPFMSLEVPGAGAVLAQPFTVSGWAIDAGTGGGTGVNRVEVLAYPNPGSGAPAITIGDATYGSARPDVQTTFAGSGSGFTPSGWSREVRGLTPGVYKLVAQARSTVTGTFNQFREVTVTVTANPHMWVDTPVHGSGVNQTFAIAGWAVDLAAGSGTGVNTVHVWKTPNPGSGAPAVFVGAAAYGGARPDIAAAYGSQFQDSGWSLTMNLTPGVYQLTAYAFSTVAQNFTQAQSVTVTVATSTPLIAIDTPASGATASQPFTLAGWAIDLGAPSGTGIQYLHIYALLSGGSGQGTFLGFATYNLPRPDVGAYYGAQFTNSGYSFTVSGLAPGMYQFGVWALSAVSGQWSVQTRTVTVQ
jgi:hypothetical protein